MTVQTYLVEGMTCGGCARGVTNAVQRVAPSLRVEVDHESGRVTIEGSHTEAQVKAAIDGAGFRFMGRRE